MFKNKLYNILDALNRMKSYDSAMERCINEKLSNTLQGYTDEVNRTCEYLLSKNNYKVLKNMARQKEKN